MGEVNGATFLTGIFYAFDAFIVKLSQARKPEWIKQFGAESTEVEQMEMLVMFRPQIFKVITSMTPLLLKLAKEIRKLNGYFNYGRVQWTLMVLQMEPSL